MSSHNYAGCQDQACALCDAYAAGMDPAYKRRATNGKRKVGPNQPRGQSSRPNS